MIDVGAELDPVKRIFYDERVNPTAVRLYVLLRDGVTLSDAAGMLGKAPRWLATYERQLVRLGYLSIVDERTARGRTRRYAFPEPDRAGGQLAS